MSAFDLATARDLTRHGVPPKEQRIIAPSTVNVLHEGGYSHNAVCTLAIVDPINLTIYYVPCTPDMVTHIRAGLAQHDPEHVKAELEGNFDQ